MDPTRWHSSLKVEGEYVLFIEGAKGKGWEVGSERERVRERERERERVRERERERVERMYFFSAVVYLSMWLTAVLADTETRESPSMLRLTTLCVLKHHSSIMAKLYHYYVVGGVCV